MENRWGNTALTMAICKGRADVVEALLERVPMLIGNLKGGRAGRPYASRRSEISRNAWSYYC